MPSNKKIKIVLIIILFLVIGFYYLKIKNFSVDFNRDIFWGVTFSSKFSKELNSDWQKNFETVLNDLRPKKVRVVAYWDEIGAAENNFNFTGNKNENLYMDRLVLLYIGNLTKMLLDSFFKFLIRQEQEKKISSPNKNKLKEINDKIKKLKEKNILND